MNWLAKFGTKIDYGKKKVNLFLGNGDKISFHGEKGILSSLISVIQVNKLWKKENTIFLANVINKDEFVTNIEDVAVVKDFKDVFPDELLSLPPYREFEFTIELIPGTIPIAKSLYRMTPKELQELKMQLQELVDRDFIKPSVSPWGAPVLFVKKKDGTMRMCNDYRELKCFEDVY